MLKLKGLTLFCALAFLVLPITYATSMPSRAVIQVDIRIYQTEAALAEVCGEQTAGCHQRLGPGRSRIHFLNPKNWCDMNRIETIGHEMLHALGKAHGPNYRPAYVSEGQETGCRNGEWWIRLSPPRL